MGRAEISSAVWIIFTGSIPSGFLLYSHIPLKVIRGMNIVACVF
jgi:hypothetical protein